MERETHLENTYGLPDHELSDEEIRDRFGSLMDKFVQAVWTDTRYSAEMMEHANQIKRKQSIWDVRTEVERAEKEAIRRCDIDHRELDTFLCQNSSVCGFGACAYARPEHTIDTPETPASINAKVKRRPRLHSEYPEYRTEDAIEAMLDRHGIVRT